ncbi:MAG: hypothetical protein OEY84_05500 [Rhodospirillaceae bacterium]|nr:hypothetical protein [Rhodospirillaceae bacterium]MDH5772571.1 hypothetical protein [Rhodospirillaceae bacterium]
MPVTTTRRHKAIAVFAGVMLSLYAGEASALCADTSEFAAIKSRTLQSELMVSGLVCGQRDNYNNFVKKFRPTLIGYGKHLRSYFSNTFGQDGERRLNKFVTRTANSASSKSVTDSSFCNRTLEKFDRLDGIDVGSYEKFIKSITPVIPKDATACTETASAVPDGPIPVQ